MHKFGKLLKGWLAHKQLSQAALASLMGLTRQQVSHYCAGYVKSPGYLMLGDFAKALGLTMEEFVAGAPKEGK